MATLKGVLFGVDSVVCDEAGRMDDRIMGELGRLVRFLVKNKVKPVFYSNRKWRQDSTRRTAEQVVEDAWGVDVEWITMAGETPGRQTAKAIETIRGRFRWKPNEVLLVGNTETDLQAAVNGYTLLLTAKWYAGGVKYGFPMESPKDVAAFIDTFCLREFPWFFRIEDGSLRYYSLAPFATKKDDVKKSYSLDFRAHIKNEMEDPTDFWAKSLCTNLYFNGDYKNINYICSYPKHEAGEWPSILDDPLRWFANCFRGRHLTDLVCRHKDAMESKRHRDTAGHLEQINSIHLTRCPTYVVRGEENKQYKQCPLAKGKTVLLVDDICTEGYSLEAGRLFLERAGVNVICVSLLKTINRNYHAIMGYRLDRTPYNPVTLSRPLRKKTYEYRDHIVNLDAPKELLSKLRSYRKWKWPREE